MIPWLAWKLHRRGLFGFTIAGFLFSFLYGEAYLQAAGTTADSQAAFGHSVSLVAKQFAFLIPLPVHPETLGGYEQYKWLSGLVVMLMLWAAVAGVGAGRGDEDRGLTAAWLAAGVSRGRLLLDRAGGFGLAVLVASLATVLGISAVAPLVHQDPNLAGEVGKGVSMALGIFACYAIAVFLAQLPGERQTATALGVGVPVLLLVLNGVADTIDSISWVGVVSPFHWMEKTSSAAPGGTFDWAACAILLVSAGVLVAGSAALFARRDLNAGVFGGRGRHLAARRTASRNPLLRLPFTEGLWEQRTGLAVWAASTLLVGGLMVAVTKSVTDSLLTDPRLSRLFGAWMGGRPYEGMLGLTWLGFALLILAGYSVVQVSRWAAQDQEGRLEMLLSTPVSRTRAVVERALEFALGSLLIVAAGYIGVAAKASQADFPLDAGRLLLASALMWPFALAFGGLGVAVVSRWPRVAVPALAGFAAVEYFLADLAPILNAPTWVANLSIFHLYGNPIANGGSAPSATGMVLVFVGGFLVALLLIRRRDVSGAA